MFGTYVSSNAKYLFRTDLIRKKGRTNIFNKIACFFGKGGKEASYLYQHWNNEEKMSNILVSFTVPVINIVHLSTS